MGMGKEHAERITVGVLKRGSMSTLSNWIVENTTLGGGPYSFDGREYQSVIASDTSQEVNVIKPSQVGISELTARLALAMVKVVQPLTAIYTLPTANFAGTFMKTRIQPVIDGSPALKGSVNKSNDNNEVKQIGDSFLYLRGAAASNAAISIPGDVIINDELDFSDQTIVSQYASRVTASPWKMFRRFSTPTVPGYGISKEFDASRRFFNFCKCNHCNHQFIPDFYTNVKVPGYTGEIRSLSTAGTLFKHKWREAHLACPKCGDKPSLEPQHREFVCQNPDDGFVAAGYQVSPFDAPSIITIPDMLQARLRYTREQDFVNFVLGQAMEDKEATLLREDFIGKFTNDEAKGPTRVMGIDVGHTYHVVINEVSHLGTLRTVHVETVAMGEIRKRYMELKAAHRVACTVIDSQPHAETVMTLQGLDANLYASVYVANRTLATHLVAEREASADTGRDFVRQVNVNRSRAFDAYMNDLRGGALTWKSTPLMEEIIGHHCSMKRVRVWDNNSQELVHTWQKTDGVDHFHHASLYAWVAAKIVGVASPLILLPTFGVHSFRLKQ